MYNTALALYSDFLGIYLNEYNELPDEKRIKWRPNNILIIHFLNNIITACSQKIKKNRLLNVID